jgi:hypothetical protein
MGADAPCVTLLGQECVAGDGRWSILSYCVSAPGRELPDSSPKTGRSTSAARGFSGSLLALSGFARLIVVEYRRLLPRPR